MLKRRFLRRGLPALLLAFLLVPAGLHAEDLTAMSLEELLGVRVTSVARQEQDIYQAPAAVFVISGEDLRRSGVTSIPEALRMVPGVEVARVNSSVWAVSARGFNGRFANKLLVLLDGRSLYNPIFSGVYWDVQNTQLADVDRIEVIRGPGAALWGANAVNGVINIITKSARETQGTLVTAVAGDEERGNLGLRQGVQLAPTAWLRLSALGFERDASAESGGNRGSDDWRLAQGGFRLDWDRSLADTLTVQGDLYRGDLGETFHVPTLVPPYQETLGADTRVTGGNLLGRWRRVVSPSADWAVQVYFDRALNKDVVAGQARSTWDLDLQQRFSPAAGHNFLWGGGYRHSSDRTSNGLVTRFSPASRRLDLYRLFAQDEWTLVEDRLKLTAGVQFERNEHTGFEAQPTLRLLFTPAPRQSLWLAVSRAVRTPSRAEDDVQINQGVIPPATPGDLPVLVALVGNRRVKSEKLTACELGWRDQVTPRLSADLSTFYNRYRDLVTVEYGTPYLAADPLPAHLVQPLDAANTLDATGYGVELALDWQVLANWQLKGSYSYLRLLFDRHPGSNNTLFRDLADANPSHQVSLRSQLDLGDSVEFDLWGRYVSSLPAPDIPAYLTCDLRLGWHPLAALQLDLVGRNLLDSRHPEFESEYLDAAAMEVERSVYARLTWTY